VYAINVGLGDVNPQLGCKKVTVQRVVHEPRGSVDVFSTLGDRLTFGGWALDVDAPTTSLSVHAYVDGSFAGVFQAAGTRDDIAAAYPGAGSAHGFGGVLTLASGRHTICLYAINVGAGSGNPALGCTTLSVAGGTAMNPIGSLDGASVQGGNLAVAGWVIDPDAPASPVDVHLYVDGQFVRAWPADGARSDVAALYPAAGAGHGFWGTAQLAEGPHTVCVYGINVGQGTQNPTIGCGRVTVAAGAWNPKGSVDGASISSRTAAIAGWALDPDVPTTSIGVHVYLDGSFAKAVTASVSRPDVAAVMPGVGPAHGYYVELPLAAGEHELCVYAINQGHGSVNPQLGCRKVTAAAAAYNPIGALDAVTRSGTDLSFSGWVFDPSSPTDAVQVHVYVDGSMVTAVTAGENTRPDVAALYPGSGAAHGFSGTVTISAAPHTVCFYAINVGAGTGNPQLACRAAA
jgi:hypothetical protein